MHMNPKLSIEENIALYTTGQYAGKWVDPFVDVSLWNIPKGSDFEKIMAGQADTTSLNEKVGKKICPKGMIETIKSANSSKNRPIASIVCVPYVQNAQKLVCPLYNYTGERLYSKAEQNLLVDIDVNKSEKTTAIQRPGCQIGKYLKYDGTAYLKCEPMASSSGGVGSGMPGSNDSSEDLQSACREGYDLQPHQIIATRKEGDVMKKVCNDNTLANVTDAAGCYYHGGNKMIYTLKCKLKQTLGGIIQYAEQLTCNNTFSGSSMGVQVVKNCSDNDQVQGIYNIKHTAGRNDDKADYQCEFDTNTYNKTITSAYTDEKGVTTTYNYVVDELGRQVNFKRAVSVFLVNDCRLCM
jgi:hypothetical protein